MRSSLLALLLLAAPALPDHGEAVAPDARIEIDARAWIDAYRRADERGQAALLKRWAAYHGSCASLLRRCRPEDRAAAAELLADLWRRNRIAPADRAAIVRDNVTLSIVEVGSWDAARGGRELVIRANRRFPFPKGTWLVWGYDIGIGDRPMRPPTNVGNSRDWEGAGPLDIGSLGSGGHYGTPSARALVEVREVVEGKVAWRHTWAVGPTRLSDIKPPGR